MSRKGELWGEGAVAQASRLCSSADPSLHFSIIMPVYNEAAVLGKTLSALPKDTYLEIIVVDGGSTDGTQEVAGTFPEAHLLQAPRGRGGQMNAGARVARGRFLVFLHADTCLGPEHLAAMRRAAADPAFTAGAFELLLTPPLPALRLIAWGANRRARVFGLPYGDQALILRRDLFQTLGGFSHRRPEDLDLVIRLRRHTRIRILTPPIASSGRRWLQQGYFRTTLKNWLFSAYHLAERTFTRRWPRKGDLAVL